MSIEALLSHGDGSDDPVDLTTWKPRRLAKDELLWIDVEAPDADDLKVIRKVLDLGDDASDALKAELDRPEVKVVEGATEVVVLSLLDDEERDPVALQVLVGDGWVVTRHQEPIASVEEHRERIKDQREVGLLSPVEFLASILDLHVDSFFAAAERMEGAVDDLDDAALRREDDLLEALVLMRRRIASVRRILGMHREVFAELARPDLLTSFEDREAKALDRVTERLERASEAVAHVREMLIGTFDVHMTKTAQRTNDIMRILTWASVILLPSVVVAGIMGMNFRVPIFDNPALFFVVVGFMVVMAAITLIAARWRGWL